MTRSCPKIKVCGVTNLEDAAMAAQLGAWALGMIFYADSPRRCSLDEAQRIVAALRRKVLLCGVFVNAPLDELLGVSEQLGLELLQLHGDEGPSYCAEVKRASGARVIKAGQVSGPGDVRDLERFHVDFHLLDARSRTPSRRAAPGRKDPQKLRAFIAAVGACADPTQQERPAQAKRPTVGQPA